MIAVALTVSWFVAVMFSPVIGVTVLPSTIKAKHGGPGRMMRAFISVLTACMRHRYITVGVTLILFVLSLFGQTLLQRQFFPSSDRPELLVTLILPANSSILATQTEVERIEALIKDDADVASYSAYVGGGAIRFYLPLDVQGDNDFVAQMVIVNQDLEARARVEAKLEDAIAGMDNFTGRVSRLELGPPVGWPVQYRVTGNTIDQARGFAQQVADLLRTSGAATTINFDWSEKTKAVRIEVNQDRARQLGMSSESIAQQLYAIHSGAVVTELRDNIYLVDVVARATNTDRLSLETLRNLQLNLPSGQAVPLIEIARITYGLDEAYVWRRDRKPTVTVQADPAPGLQAPTVFQRLRPQIEEIAATFPPGAFIEEGGTVEKSNQSTSSVLAQAPLMIGGGADRADGPAPELLAAGAGALGGAARLHRRRGGAPLHPDAVRLHRAPRRDRAHRHDRAELGDPGRPDRVQPRPGATDLGRGAGGDRAPAPADPAHGGGGDPRHDPDHARRVLGADGLRHRRRPRRRDAAHAPLPAGALCRLVPGDAAAA